MPKTVIIGAGSKFGTRLSIDILSHDALCEGELALVDINPDHLDPASEYVQTAVDQHDVPVDVTAHLDREDALDGADYVIVSISVGGPAYNGEPYYHEVAIPRAYGVDQQVADTVGPGGVFRTLRTAPEMVDIAKDMEAYCPDAQLLNYTNPMAMLCWTMATETDVDIVGLCHSVQGTAKSLAGYIDANPAAIEHWVAGINHLAWFLTFRRNGEDAYPDLREAMTDPAIFEQDPVRFEIFLQFDSFVTESSRHMSEYVPYFRDDEATMAEYDLESRLPERDPEGTRWDGEYGERIRARIRGDEPIDLSSSHEYAAGIMNAMETGEPFHFNGNVMNDGSIENLPDDCCVEVPCWADETGIHQATVGRLPSQLASLCQSNVDVQRLTVEAVRERNLRAAYHAILRDPLTGAVQSPRETEDMFEEMVTALEPWLADHYPAAY